MATAAQPPKTTSAFRLLLWLKWTLMFRGFQRDRMRLAGTILMMFLFAPISLGLAYFCWYMCTSHPQLTPYVALMALGFSYIVWLVTPLLGFPLNESYDPTRLFIYPVSYRTIFLAAAVGGFLDLPTFLILPVFIALIFAVSPNFFAGVACLLLVALFLVQTIATAQALMLALIGFLRSRRFRDITMVLLPLFGMAIYVVQQTIIKRMDLFISGFRQIVESPFWQVLKWLPPGWTQSGMMAAREGRYGIVLLDLLLLAAVCALMASAAAFAMRRLYLGDRGVLVVKQTPLLNKEGLGEVSIGTDPSQPPLTKGRSNVPSPIIGGRVPEGRDGGQARGEGSGVRVTAGERAGGWARLLPPALAAVIQKELRYIWREPQYKVLGIQMLTTPIFFVIFFLLNPGFRLITGPYGPFAGHMQDPFSLFMRALVSFRVLGVLLLGALPLIFNIFGGEGAAITVLFSFPTPRRYLFVGKNLVHAVVLFILCSLGVLVGCYFMKTLAIAPLGILETAIVLPVVLAIGNLISIRFPYRMVVRGQRWGPGGRVSFGGSNSGTGVGCAFGFIYMLCYIATFVAIIPAVTAVALPVLLDAGPFWFLLGLALAIAYAAGLYAAGLYMAVNYLPTREIAIVERLVPNDTG